MSSILLNLLDKCSFNDAQLWYMGFCVRDRSDPTKGLPPDRNERGRPASQLKGGRPASQLKGGRGLDRMRKTGAKRIYLATIRYRMQLDRLTDSN